MEKILKKFKKIEPKEEFKKRSLAVILNSPQNEYRPKPLEYLGAFFTFQKTIGLTAVAALLIISGLSFLNNRLVGPSLVSNLNPQDLNKEMESFNIQFSQIKYYEDSAKRIEVALLKTSGEPVTKEQNEEINKILNEIAL